jgi:hypothetical protein
MGGWMEDGWKMEDGWDDGRWMGFGSEADGLGGCVAAGFPPRRVESSRIRWGFEGWVVLQYIYTPIYTSIYTSILHIQPPPGQQATNPFIHAHGIGMRWVGVG